MNRHAQFLVPHVPTAHDSHNAFAPAQPALADHLRRALNLDHLHLVLLSVGDANNEPVRTIFSTWTAKTQALAMAERWHRNLMSMVARRSKRGALGPTEFLEAAAQARLSLHEADEVRSTQVWIFPIPQRAGISGEMWVSRKEALSSIEEGFLAATALPLLRAMSPRYARLSGKSSRLTPREIECLRGASEGKTSEQIATSLAIAPTTVETHFKHATTKLAASNRSHAVAEAMRCGMIA